MKPMTQLANIMDFLIAIIITVFLFAIPYLVRHDRAVKRRQIDAERFQAIADDSGLPPSKVAAMMRGKR